MELGFSLWFGWKQQNMFTWLFKPTVNRQKKFWVGVFIRRYFFYHRCWPKNEICYARGLANKQKIKFEGGPLPLKKQAFYQWFCCSLWRSHCIFCSVHKWNVHAGAWFASTNDGDGARSKLCPFPSAQERRSRHRWSASPLPASKPYIYIYMYVYSTKEKSRSRM